MGIGALFWASGRVDGPLQAPILLEALLEEEVLSPTEGRLPLGTGPCVGKVLHPAAGQPTPPLLLCRHNALGAVAFWANRRVEHTARPLVDIDGPILLGGPEGLAQGTLLFERDDALHWTTSARAAEAMAESAGRAWLVFGHKTFDPGVLEAEQQRGLWVEDPQGWPPPVRNP